MRIKSVKAAKAVVPAVAVKAVKATKAKPAPARVVNALASISKAAFAYARNKSAVIALIKATGATKEARHNFIVGHMAQALNPKATDLSAAMLAKAETALKAKGKDSKGKTAKGQSRRTEAQERAYGAARKAWHLVVKSAGVEAADKRGGANNKGKVNPASNPPEAAPQGKVETVAPKAPDAETAAMYVTQQAVALLAYANKNAGPLAAPYGTAIKAFHAAIMAIKAGK